MHLDRAISGALVGFLLALGVFFLLGAKGCTTRQPRPWEHPGTNAVERLHYCARFHQGAHLPQDQGDCERW